MIKEKILLTLYADVPRNAWCFINSVTFFVALIRGNSDFCTLYLFSCIFSLFFYYSFFTWKIHYSASKCRRSFRWPVAVESKREKKNTALLQNGEWPSVTLFRKIAPDAISRDPVFPTHFTITWFPFHNAVSHDPVPKYWKGEGIENPSLHPFWN